MGAWPPNILEGTRIKTFADRTEFEKCICCPLTLSTIDVLLCTCLSITTVHYFQYSHFYPNYPMVCCKVFNLKTTYLHLPLHCTFVLEIVNSLYEKNPESFAKSKNAVSSAITEEEMQVFSLVIFSYFLNLYPILLNFGFTQ